MPKVTKGYVIKSESIVIDAPPSIVWTYVNNPEQYALYSGGAIKAHVEGLVEVDSKISLKLGGLPTSNEVISQVDVDKSLGWKRKFPIGGSTVRVQELTSIEDGSSSEKTRSTITLQAPGPIGFFTYLLFKRKIENAFDALNEGIKNAAENTDPNQHSQMAQLKNL